VITAQRRAGPHWLRRSLALVYVLAFGAVAFLSLRSDLVSRGTAKIAGTYETTRAQARPPKGARRWEA
jgi:hypothetical protein